MLSLAFDLSLGTVLGLLIKNNFKEGSTYLYLYYNKLSFKKNKYLLWDYFIFCEAIISNDLL